MANHLGRNLPQLKQENTGMILKLLLTGKAHSRIELSHEMGLTKMSITKLIQELLDRGILKETFPQRIPGQGRNPIRLVPGDHAPYMIGLFVGRSKCTGTLSDLLGHPIRTESVSRPSGAVPSDKTTLKSLTALVEGLLRERDPSSILGIGISCSLFMDQKIGTKLADHFSIPVYMDTQERCEALMESYYGEGQPYSDFLYIGYSRFITSGFMFENRLLRSSLAAAPGIGHISIDPEGPRCRCGNVGCLELSVGSTSIQNLLTAKTELKKTFREFCEFSEDQKLPETDSIFEDMISTLAYALQSVINLTGVETIIFGQEGAFIPTRFLSLLEKQLTSRIHRKIHVLRSAFEVEDASLAGVSLILEMLFQGTLAI